jgi:hypothetical protein
MPASKLFSDTGIPVWNHINTKIGRCIKKKFPARYTLIYLEKIFRNEKITGVLVDSAFLCSNIMRIRNVAGNSSGKGG